MSGVVCKRKYRLTSIICPELACLFCSISVEGVNQTNPDLDCCCFSFLYVPTNFTLLQQCYSLILKGPQVSDSFSHCMFFPISDFSGLCMPMLQRGSVSISTPASNSRPLLFGTLCKIVVEWERALSFPAPLLVLGRPLCTETSAVGLSIEYYITPKTNNNCLLSTCCNVQDKYRFLGTRTNGFILISVQGQ